MSLEQWAFSDAEPLPTADGKHTFYRVRGERATKRDLYGTMTAVDASGLWPAFPIEGEGATPEEALSEAMRRAIQADEQSYDMMRNAQIAMYGGKNFR